MARFAAWALAGALGAVVIVAMPSIGLFLAPLAVLALWTAARRTGAGQARASGGLLAGVGLLALGVGLGHLPEANCIHGQIPAGSTGCEEFDETPWIVAGALGVAASVLLFRVRARDRS